MKLCITNISETVSSDVLTTQICWSSKFWEYSTSFGHLAFLLGIVSLRFNTVPVRLCLSSITAARALNFRKVPGSSMQSVFTSVLNPNMGHCLCAESVHVLKFHLNFCPYPTGCISAYQKFSKNYEGSFQVKFGNLCHFHWVISWINSCISEIEFFGIMMLVQYYSELRFYYNNCRLPKIVCDHITCSICPSDLMGLCKILDFTA